MSKEENNSYGMCWCFRRRYKLRVAESPQEIKEIFERYSENGMMSLHYFQRFVTEVQGEDDQVIENDEAKAIMEVFINLEDYKRHKGLNLEAFFRYLLTDINSPLPSPPKVHHDMTAPLSHYFIYTGHNSYLTGNQFNSDCSDIPIIDALHRGVRVIELDLWPNSTKDDVHVLHGGTLTTPVELIKCLNSIKEHAFVTSEYPVILTLEDHLTSDLQAKVAQMLNETFGDALFCSTSEKFTEFPSPESLKKKIVISTKLPKEYLESESTKMMHNKLEAFDEHHYDKCVDEEDHKVDYSNLIQNHCHAYKKLISIPTRKRNGGVEEWLRDDPNAVTRVSLREHNLENAVIDHAADVVRFTHRNLLRIFPKGSRLDSSNYNPMTGWTHGAQMVAFNMQGHGKSLWLMQGLFRANGGCGYVRKPDCLLNVDPENEVFDPSKKLPVKQILKLRIYMGEGWHLDFNKTHFDLYSPPDFYVKVGVVGVRADSITKKTKVIENDWIPTWNEEFEFPLTCPELALLRIEVDEYDVSDKDDFGGQTCLPVSELKTGIRAVPLHNHKGDKYNSVKLLMHFEFV